MAFRSNEGDVKEVLAIPHLPHRRRIRPKVHRMDHVTSLGDREQS
jgi:hypothetical protein